MLTKDTKFVLAVLLQVAVIFLLIIFKYSILVGGVEVYLKIAPVDPRDPLRGDYVTFTYEVSQVPSYVFDYAPVQNGDLVYIPLVAPRSNQFPAEQYWKIDASGQYLASKKLPTVANEDVQYIKARVTGEQMGGGSFDSPVRVEYGIEQYFIEEGKGKNFSFWNHEAAAKVKVDKNGNPVLDSLYVDGKKWP